MQISALLRGLAAVALVGLTPIAGSGGELSPDLRDRARGLAPEQRIAVLIRLRDAVDLPSVLQESERAGEDTATRRRRLIQSLQRRAGRSGRALRELLEREGVESMSTLWIHNGLAAELPARLLDEIAMRPEVRSVRLDAVVRMAEPVSGPGAPAGWNLLAVGAPALWDEGHTGQGVIVAGMDSGVDPFHPDIGPKQRPAHGWFDPYEQHANPYDPTGHGTQTMGLILGGDNSGQTIGMAPGAQWIAVKVFNDAGEGILSRMHEGYQWLLDPDGDPDTDDLPDIANSSWTLDGVDQCDLEFEADIAVLRTAEVAVVFSAGNFGPFPSSSVSPSNNAGSLAVGAVDEFANVASFSGRGPSACDASIYPELAAPGVGVHTADLTLGGIFPDTWVDVTGTSFAGPHVSGALALLWSAHPEASLPEIEGALLAGARDLGAAGPDQESGWGLLDVKASHRLLGTAPVPALPTWAHALAALLLALVLARSRP